MAAVPSPADLLDAALGDPWDEANPAGHRAALEADRGGEPPAGAEALLAAVGLNAQFVPRSEGGEFTRADELAAVLRTLWRRDPGLALGYGLAPFLAGVEVWGAGDAAQRAKAAGLLLGGHRLAACGPGLALGERPPHAGIAAARTDEGWLLAGRQPSVANLRRAGAFVVLARTGAPCDEAGLSHFLVERNEILDAAAGGADGPGSSGGPSVAGGAVAGPDSDAGLPGAGFEDAVLADRPIPHSALLGAVGQGFANSLRSTEFARALLPSAGLGALDTALRAVTALALEQRVGSRRMAEVPAVRAMLTGVFADLLAADALCATTLRVLHLAPAQLRTYAPAGCHVSSLILREGFDVLKAMLGARSALREGRHAIFRKLGRDSLAAASGPCSSYSCLAALVPQLLPRAGTGRIAGRQGALEPPGLWFALGAELAEAGFGPVPPDAADASCAADHIRLLLDLPVNGLDAAGEPLGRLVEHLRKQAARLRRGCGALEPADPAGGPGAPAFAAAGRHALLLAAAACRGVHRQRPDLLDETALAAVLDRLTRRLPAAGVLTQTERTEVEDHLWIELLRRVRQPRLLDLSARPIPG
jgi:alkylation response protein AidB-like acyl-CoA dehydrogenase